MPVALVLRRHGQNAVGVDVEDDLDLRDAAWGRHDAFQVETPQRAVAAGLGALALKDVNLDLRLAVFRAVENTSSLRVGMVVFREMSAVMTTTERLDAQAERRDVQQDHVLHVAREHARLNRRAERDDLVRVDALVGLLAEELGDHLLDDGHTRRATDQHHLGDVRRGLAGIGERLLAGVKGALHQVVDHRLELGAGQPDIEMLRAGCVGREERQVDRGLELRAELDLGLFRRVLETLQNHLVAAHIDAGVLLELGHEVLDDALVDVVAAQVRVTVGAHDIDDLVTPPRGSKCRTYRHRSRRPAMRWSSVLSRPYASAAAVGSLTIRFTSSPAILPASLVA